MAYHSLLTFIMPAAFALVATILAIKFIMPYFYGAGIVAEDRNKKVVKKIPGSGGTAVAFGITIGILAYTFGASFLFKPIISIPNILATALAIVLIAAVGFMDDLNVKTQRVKVTGMEGINQGLKQWQKPLLTLVGALPLIAIDAGVKVLHLPFLGAVNFGILYPIVVVPLVVVFVANAYNLLGGFNGLEGTTGLIAGFGFIIYFYIIGNSVGLFLSSIMVGALLAFLLFNWYPAKILPGDSFTYCIGGCIAAIIIIGHAESFGFIVFIPWIIEFLLHLKGKFKTTDLGIRQNDGTIKAPYGKKIFSLTHIAMNLKRTKERDVTIMLAAFELLFVVIALALAVGGLL
jgi:UDP-N-acetylglucosamine--dolichyl-phosphate N-acetylglucosaminephosphotransferase